MNTIQFIINIIFTIWLLVWMSAALYLLYRIWQSFTKLIEVMQTTILENARKNVDTLGEMAKVIETHQQIHEPPS